MYLECHTRNQGGDGQHTSETVDQWEKASVSGHLGISVTLEVVRLEGRSPHQAAFRQGLDTRQAYSCSDMPISPEVVQADQVAAHKRAANNLPEPCQHGRSSV